MTLVFRTATAAFWLALLLSTTGCGSGELATAPIKGKVMMGGQPVTEGGISFSPLTPDAKPAVGDIKPDGTFELSTYGTNDGAVFGKHRVAFSAPLPKPASDPNAPPPPSGLQGAAIEPAEVEVKAGTNEFTFELKAAGS